MSQAVATEPIPIVKDSDDVLRVGGTRVPLETVVTAFDLGATPEEIAQDYPVLRLDDIYAVLTYYLRHREEVQDYLRQRQRLADSTRRAVDQRFSQAGLKASSECRTPSDPARR